MYKFMYHIYIQRDLCVRKNEAIFELFELFRNDNHCIEFGLSR